MSDDAKNPTNESGGPEGAQPDMTRRKILYAAPVIVSQRLFNSLTGCGKVDPTVQSCSLVAMTS
jgi:hypothetical protein